MSEMEGRVGREETFAAVLTTHFLWSTAVSEPGSDAATQGALYSPSVESGQNVRWDGFPQPSQEVEMRLGFRDQVKFYARWTQGNLVFFTISTGEPWMFSG